MDFLSDADYLRSCARLGITPSSDDYDEYRAEIWQAVEDDREDGDGDAR
jgi:hypothetical protein